MSFDPTSPDHEPTEQPAAQPDDVDATLARLQAQLSELERKASAGVLTSQPADEELTSRVQQARDTYHDWPQQGDKFKDQPQPYELQALGLPQPGVTRDHLPAGEPDNLSPIVVSHNEPNLQPGHAGSSVARLASYLAKAGYPTNISRGQNWSYAFDDSVHNAVDSFKRDYHVVEDSSGFRTAEEAAKVVGPWIWEALHRVAAAA